MEEKGVDQIYIPHLEYDNIKDQGKFCIVIKVSENKLSDEWCAYIKNAPRFRVYGDTKKEAIDKMLKEITNTLINKKLV